MARVFSEIRLDGANTNIPNSEIEPTLDGNTIIAPQALFAWSISALPRSFARKFSDQNSWSSFVSPKSTEYPALRSDFRVSDRKYRACCITASWVDAWVCGLGTDSDGLSAGPRTKTRNLSRANAGLMRVCRASNTLGGFFFMSIDGLLAISGFRTDVLINIQANLFVN